MAPGEVVAKVWPSAREATHYLCAWQPDGLGMVVDFSTTFLFLTIEGNLESVMKEFLFFI